MDDLAFQKYSLKLNSIEDLALIESHIGPSRRIPFVLLETLVEIPNPSPSVSESANPEARSARVRKLAKSKEKQVGCHLCSQKFGNKGNLYAHLKVHKAEVPEPYLCPLCSQTFGDSDELKFHQGTAHSDQHKIFVSKRTKKKIKRFFAPSLKLECSIQNCGRKFPYQSLLDKHLLAHSKEKPHRCDICGSKYTTDFKLRKHLEKKKCKEVIARKATSEFSCEICDIPLANKKSVSNHRRKIHGIVPEVEKKSYICLFCGYDAKGSYVLAKHNRIHTGEKPFKCKGCGKGFTDNSNYRVHVRTCKLAKEKGILPEDKSGPPREKPDSKGNYHCSKCHYKSSCHGNKVKHESTHGNQVPCPHCSTGFKARYGLICHLKAEHPDFYTVARPSKSSNEKNTDLRNPELDGEPKAVKNEQIDDL